MSRLEVDKDPWLAVNLSMFFPGIGQFYGEYILKGIIFFSGQLILLIMTVWHIFAADGNTVTGLICLGIAIIIYLVNILDAHLGIYNKRRDKLLEKIPRKQKNPWFAVFVSRILPGLGHLYLQKPRIGLTLLVGSIILFALDDFIPKLLIITPMITAIATYDSYRTFPGYQIRWQRSLVTIMAALIFFIGLMGNYFPQWLGQRFERFIIPSESMKPTLQVGDIVFVSKSPNYVPPRGDIVVFTAPENLKALDPKVSDYYIKRVIGTPGNEVRIMQGTVYINNQPIEETYIAQPPQYQLESQLIKDNTYLVLGDNRNDSFDSHIWGTLPKEFIVGKAYKIGWPPDRIQSLEIK